MVKENVKEEILLVDCGEKMVDRFIVIFEF